MLRQNEGSKAVSLQQGQCLLFAPEIQGATLRVRFLVPPKFQETGSGSMTFNATRYSFEEGYLHSFSFSNTSDSVELCISAWTTKQVGSVVQRSVFSFLKRAANVPAAVAKLKNEETNSDSWLEKAKPWLENAKQLGGNILKDGYLSWQQEANTVKILVSWESDLRWLPLVLVSVICALLGSQVDVSFTHHFQGLLGLNEDFAPDDYANSLSKTAPYAPKFAHFRSDSTNEKRLSTLTSKLQAVARDYAAINDARSTEPAKVAELRKLRESTIQLVSKSCKLEVTNSPQPSILIGRVHWLVSFCFIVMPFLVDADGIPTTLRELAMYLRLFGHAVASFSLLHSVNWGISASALILSAFALFAIFWAENSMSTMRGLGFHQVVSSPMIEDSAAMVGQLVLFFEMMELARIAARNTAAPFVVFELLYGGIFATAALRPYLGPQCLLVSFHIAWSLMVCLKEASADGTSNRRVVQKGGNATTNSSGCCFSLAQIVVSVFASEISRLAAPLIVVGCIVKFYFPFFPFSAVLFSSILVCLWGARR